MSKVAPSKKTVLITGCSDGSLGASLATSFHNAGLHVYATARNPAKMAKLAALGIETFALDPTSSESIAAAVARTPQLDILVNNAGGFYAMPFSDLDISKAKELFNLNVWSYLEVAQAFLPLLVESKGMIVNQSSSLSVAHFPFQSAYTASKAAISNFSHCMRLELEPFGVTVVDLKSGLTKSNEIGIDRSSKKWSEIPKGSLYQIAKEKVEASINGEAFTDGAMETNAYGDFVVKALLKKKAPPAVWVCIDSVLTLFCAGCCMTIS